MSIWGTFSPAGLAADIFLAQSIKYLPPTCSDTAVLFCYFNPTNSLKLLENFNAVKTKLDAAQIPNFSIELCIGDQQPVTRADFVVYSPTALFYKESLWNNLEPRVPAQYTKLIFIDADVVFSAPDWVDRCSAVLDTCDVMQPMARCRRLGNSGNTFSRAVEIIAGPRWPRNAYSHPGFAAGVRRAWFQKIKFYPAVIGSGDSVFWEFVAKKSLTVRQLYAARDVTGQLSTYKRLFAAMSPKVGALTGVTLVHLPHGVFSKRKHIGRFSAFSARDFKLFLRTADGLLYWPPETQSARRAQNYFAGRMEDGHEKTTAQIRAALRDINPTEIPISCITLRRATERQSQMRQEWAEQRGISFNFFYAADKRDICRHETGTRDGGVLPYSPDEAVALMRRELTCGERACRLSHFLCARKLLREYPNAPFYIMLEDDVRPLFNDAAEFFCRVICGFYEQQADVLLAHNLLKRVPRLKNLQLFSCQLQLRCGAPLGVGNQCLIFSRPGLNQYCQQLQLSCPADAWQFWPDYSRVMCLVNNLVEHLGDTTYISGRPGEKRAVLD